MIVPLNVVKSGQKCRVLNILNSPSKIRLLQLGFLPETEIEVIRKAPFREPTEFKIGPFNVGLRNEEAKTIIVDTI